MDHFTMKKSVLEDFEEKLKQHFGEVKKEATVLDICCFELPNNISFFLKVSYEEDLYCLSYELLNEVRFLPHKKGNATEEHFLIFSKILREIIAEKYTNHVLWIQNKKKIHFVRESGKEMYELFQFATDLAVKKQKEWEEKWNYKGYVKIKNQQRDYLYAIEIRSDFDQNGIPFGAFGSKEEVMNVFERIEKEIETVYGSVEQVLQAIKNTFPSYVESATHYGIETKIMGLNISFDIGEVEHFFGRTGIIRTFIGLEDNDIVVSETDTNSENFQSQIINSVMRIIILEQTLIEYNQYASNVEDFFISHESEQEKELSSMEMDGTTFEFSGSHYEKEKSRIRLQVYDEKKEKEYDLKGNIETISEQIKPLIVEFAKQMRMKLLFKKRHQND